MNKLFLHFCLFLICTSCATPTVINVISPNDNALNCQELSSEITKANKYANEAQEAKKMSKPHNIAALIFFIPGVGMTMMNAELASEAARDRTLHLNKLKEKKDC